MTGAAARAWIAGLDILGMRFGLERIRALLAALGHPERSGRALHIVGTNGKSSSARLAAAALGSQGPRAGAYLSPHIVDWTERIQIGGAPVSEERFGAAVGAVHRAAAGLGLPPGDSVTQFEALTAAALVAFRDAGVEAWAIEAGLGGRYDATNVLPGAAVALTNVALEHTDLLGDTEAAITAEKLAVCPDGSDRLVVGPLTPAAREAVTAECARRGLRPVRHGMELWASGQGDRVRVVTPLRAYDELPLGVRGAFQRDNLAVALAGAELVLGGPLDPGPLRDALAAVRIPGRLEVVAGDPLTVLDGAHNPAGMEAMAASLPGVVGSRRPVAAVLSVLGDKDAAAMTRRLSRAVGLVVATRSSHARAASPERLAELARAAGAPARVVPGPAAALAAAREAAGPEGAVVVAGSLYLLADLRPLLVPEAAEPPATLARAREGRTSPTAEE